MVRGSREATLQVWEIESEEYLHVLVGHLAVVRCVQYDGRLVVSGVYDYMVKVWGPRRAGMVPRNGGCWKPTPKRRGWCCRTRI